MTAEFEAKPRRGAIALTAGIVAILFFAGLIGYSGRQLSHDQAGPWGWLIAISILAIIASAVSFFGLTIVQPNTAKVVVLFGTYLGTLKKEGFWWVNPF